MIPRRYREVKPRGEITIFLALIASVLMGLIVVLIESARLQLIRMNVEELMDTGLTSCFGEYNIWLFDKYDLLFIDSSYRGQDESGIDSVLRHLSQYITVNADYSKMPVTGEWYREDLTDVTAVSYELASDGDGEVIKYQASLYIDRCGSRKYGRSIEENSVAVDRISEIDLMAEWDEVLALIEGFGIPVDNPGRIVREMVLSEDDLIMDKGLSSIKTDVIPSKRALEHGNGAPEGNRKGTDDDFVEYLMQKMGCYTGYTDEQQLKCELEYLIWGNGSDRDNMAEAAERLIKIRESDNLRCIRSDPGRMEEADALARETAELCIADPLAFPVEEFTELIRESIVYAWAYAESAVDVSRLLNGGRCPVNKSSSDIALNACDITDFMSYLNGVGGSGPGYRDYIGVFLKKTDDRLRRLRCMDIIEENCRMYYNDCFNIDGCVDYLEAEAGLSSGYGYSHKITRVRYYE